MVGYLNHRGTLMSEYFKAKDILQQLVLAAIKKMDLVTREEFDIQTRVLLKTRHKVEQLEKALLAHRAETTDGNI